VNFSNCPIPGWRGSSEPEGLCTNGVLIVAEALGSHEAEDGLPMRPHAPAGSVLERAIRRSGFDRQQFALWNIVPVQPPNNWLEGAPYEAGAITWGLTFLPEVLTRFRPRVILALGNVALKALTTLSGISDARGYPLPSRYDIPVIGSLHPAYLRRGKMSYLSVLMHDLRFAVALASAKTASNGLSKTVEFWSPVLWRQAAYDIPWPLPPINAIRPEPRYIQYPSEQDAIDYLHECERQPNPVIAYDIETPYGATKETDEDDTSDKILSIQFSLAPKTGIFLPWRGGFIEAAKRILELGNPKVGANCWRFDAPKLAANGARIGGTQHDLRWAFKHFQPDLSASLQFIASFYAPGCGPWKHLAQVQPQWYGIRDVDITLRCL
jgi:uracil-DNA glycosylase family 4